MPGHQNDSERNNMWGAAPLPESERSYGRGNYRSFCSGCAQWGHATSECRSRPSYSPAISPVVSPAVSPAVSRSASPRPGWGLEGVQCGRCGRYGHYTYACYY